MGFAQNSVERRQAMQTLGGALLFPLACIWFPNELREYFDGPFEAALSHKSPAWMVRVGGWVLLLLPAVLFWFIYRS